MSKVLVIFDFCDTLIGFQTWNAFLMWAYQKYYGRKHKEGLFVKIFKHYPFSYLFNYKNYLVTRIKWIPHNFILSNIDEFVAVLKNNQNTIIVDALKRSIEEWADIVIASAWFMDYISVWSRRYLIKDVFATKLKVIDWLYTWQLLWPDIFWEEKVNTIKKYYDLSQYKEIRVYSDSFSDLPLFNIANKKYFVTKNRKIGVPEGFTVIEL